ncbi:MAG: DNA internalization-related competence protein ComEC/Rec2, partial [Myxococcota bacterium]
ERLSARGAGGGLVAALVVGSRRDLDERTTEAFRALGLSHLLAISGLHVASVAALAYLGLAFLLRRARGIAAHTDTRKGAALGALGAAGLYALVGGWGIPLQRAVLLLAIVLVMGLTGRRPRAGDALSAVLIVVLALEPAALFDLGAQLSFAATAGLCHAGVGAGRERAIAGERGMGAVAWIVRHCATGSGASLRVSASAVLATTPILAAHAVAMSGFALAANLVALPLFGFVVLPLALFAGVLAGLGGAPWLVGIVCEVVGAFEAVVVGVGLPAEAFLIRSTAGGGAFALTVLLALAGLACRTTHLRVWAALASISVVAVGSAPRIDVPRSALLALDVGRGDALLLRADDAFVLIDAGAHPPGNPEAGNRTVLRALNAIGVEGIDLLVASHADLDHRGGLPAVVERLWVGEIWIPSGSRRDPDLRDLVAAAQRRGVPLRERAAGDAPLRVGRLQVDTLWPLAGPGSGSRNERSLVTRIEVDGVRVLLPADIGARSEARLVEAGIDLEADVLVLGHHGSRGSTTERFLEAVSPRLAVVSAPCTSHGGLPHPDALRRAREADSDLWWTGRDGAVFVSLARPLTAWAFRDPRQRPGCGPD